MKKNVALQPPEESQVNSPFVAPPSAIIVACQSVANVMGLGKSIKQGFVWIAAGCLGLCVAAAAQPRTMSALDIVDLPQIERGEISPDGVRFLTEVTTSDWTRNRRDRQIWVGELREGRARQATRAAKAQAQDGAWAPRGDSFAFVSQRAGDKHAQLYLMELRGGDARRLVSHPTAVRAPQFSVDGLHVYFLADDVDEAAGASGLDKNELGNTSSSDKGLGDGAGKKQPLRPNRQEIPLFDHSPVRRHLWRADIERGAAERLTSGEFVITRFDLGRDGRTVLFSRAPNVLLDDERNAELYLMRLGEGEARRLTDNNYREGSFRLAPDARSLLFLADAQNDRYAAVNQNLFRLATSGGAPEEIAAGLPYEINEALWSADGRRIYFSATTGVRTEVFAIEPGRGEPQPITRGDLAVKSLSLSQNGLLGFLQSSAISPGEMMYLDTRRPGVVKQAGHMHAELAERFVLPRQEAVQWTAPDGQRIEGLLTYPTPYVAGRRYPLIAQLHGGPRAADVFGLWKASRFEPLLAAKGYVVLATNYRGGVGYGDAFLQGMNGGYFRSAHTDVLSGVDHIVALGVADPDKLGVMGWSAGGHMTNKLVTLTDRFKAAASGAGASDWPSMVLLSDIRWHRADWFGSPPYGGDVDWPLYDATSPLREAHKVKTPLLLLVGAQDERVPAVQSVIFFRALKALGAAAELYVAPREPHGFRELRHRLFQINVQMDWFAKHIRGETYVWEEPPPSPQS